ncbi:Hypothetical protein PACV_207 [Pacmanvirus A23]|uniref:Hypothetical protein n=1 Tax=Pacmanvirus A23 TaxID=1932881 RepID=UPI000A092F9F|nr:Hypothetical protein B9W72_gp205 [Pacmanvirus A23]SIP85922.1 Hypothetical protein PACV_207 [Pacmanvirus A23]
MAFKTGLLSGAITGILGPAGYAKTPYKYSMSVFLGLPLGGVLTFRHFLYKDCDPSMGAAIMITDITLFGLLGIYGAGFGSSVFATHAYRGVMKLQQKYRRSIIEEAKREISKGN